MTNEQNKSAATQKDAELLGRIDAAAKKAVRQAVVAKQARDAARQKAGEIPEEGPEQG
ncbi:MAG: hypothetical protein AB7P76_03555 [Candidatus Melainabacteria bacterium]